MTLKKQKRRGIIFFLFFSTAISYLAWVLWSKAKLLPEDQSLQPIINIINKKGDKPEVDYQKQIADSVCPWKQAPKHEVYSPKETKNFKTEELFLPEHIQSWYNQAKNFSSLSNTNFNAIFHGKSGTGKTSLARRLAKESSVTFVSIKGSDFQDRVYEQRTILDKFTALFKSLKNNTKVIDSDKKIIIFLDEIDQIGDGLKCIKEILAQVDNGIVGDLKILWIGATNHLNEKVDEAVYENNDRIRYELNFNWNKSTFVNYAIKNSLSGLLDINVPACYDSEKKQVKRSQKLGELILREATRCDEIYNRFNFKNLEILNERRAEFISYFKKLINIDQINLEDYQDHIISFNYKEWKGAIGEHYPQVTKMELVNNNVDQWINLEDNKIVPQDTFVSLVFEYTLDLFWVAKKKGNLGKPWDMVNPTSFLIWARRKDYSLEDLGLIIHRGKDEDKQPCSIAQFIPKVFPKAA